MGKAVSQFTVSLKGKIGLVAFNQTVFETLAAAKIMLAVPNNSQLTAFDKTKLSFAVKSVDYLKGEASVEAAFSGEANSATANQLIDKNKLVGLNKTQLESYLAGLPGIGNYTIKFSPAFITKVPSLVDKIDIKVAK